ncbi:MAG: hypothetical protein EOO88_19430 [Pedobacter sp.]|nr:MAG: hypothetical protein EOO88_19430 [Pedobacter sp.]
MTGIAMIKTSKVKLVILLICSLAFVIGGVFMYQGFSFRGAAILRSIIAIVTIAFFGIATLYASLKLFDGKPGFIFLEDGFVDNSSGISAGEVLWKDITSLRTSSINGQSFISIAVADPQMYIDRQANILKRKAMTLNLRMYGSPIALSANGLDISFNDLVSEIETRYAKFQSS